MASLVPPAATPKPTEKVDYMNLPCPIPYEEIHREAISLSSPSPLIRCLFLILLFDLVLIYDLCVYILNAV